MSDMFQLAWEHLVEDEWPVVVAQPERVIQTLFTLESTQYNCYLHVLADQRQLAFYSIYPGHVPLPRIPYVHEFVTRANWNLIIGNLELQLDNGSLRFRTSLTLGKGSLQPELLRPLTLGNVSALFRFQPGIDALIHDESVSVAEALSKAI